MSSYLLEIGLEEIPANVILPAIQQLEEKIIKSLKDLHLTYDTIEKFSTPRRLAVCINGLPEKQEDRKELVKGPPFRIAKDSSGNWSKAAQGFAKKNGVSPDDLIIRTIQENEFLCLEREIVGLNTFELIKTTAASWITTMSFPRNMRWGNHKMRYIRPIRWIVSLWDDKLLPISLEMLNAGITTRGHRFLSHGEVPIRNVKEYSKLLERLYVRTEYSKRRQTILDQIWALEQEHGFKVVIDEKLLEEVTNLVEWPTVTLGKFEKEFLDVPSEVLVTSMATHQRYFPVYSQDEKLLPFFIAVRNGNSRALEQVTKGNEKVLRARLSDARFFYEEDCKKEIVYFQDQAKNVIFLKKRGTVAQRVERISELSEFISKKIKLDEKQKQNAMRIAELCKFDLQTQMVYEFPELQGVMGEYYAYLKGEDPVVCRGIREHYYPKNVQDSLPDDIECIPSAIADKQDMLTTAFSLGIIPSGSADPYALRRMAHGILQIMVGCEVSINLQELILCSLEIIQKQQNLDLDITVVSEELSKFFNLRQKHLLQEAEIRYDVIDAILKSKELTPLQQWHMAEKLMEHVSQPQFKKSVEGIVRTINITAKQKESIPENPDESQWSDESEKVLFNLIKSLLISPINLDTFLPTIDKLEPFITNFFDRVMIMDSDQAKRQNRLWLCYSIANWSLRYLDLRDLIFPSLD